MKALVVFSDAEPERFLPLKRGFRHCFVVLNDGTDWVAINPMRGYLWAGAADAETDLRSHYESQGMRCVEVDVAEPVDRGFPTFWWSCVELVKRAIGLRSFWIVTPWQLYKAIREDWV